MSRTIDKTSWDANRPELRIVLERALTLLSPRIAHHGTKTCECYWCPLDRGIRRALRGLGTYKDAA